ncbi:MAG: class I SAM-dependent methyltransferase [Planctomycetota bacterium]|jgi:SAM-dependent methyltransferase
MSEWFESSELWETVRPCLFQAPLWEHAASEVDAVLELLGLEKGARILDLCSGPGRHSVELARRGYRVTAVDIHPAYLEELRSRNDTVETVVSDMRDFKRDGEFDAALNLFSSFGFFEDPADDLNVLKNLHASLKKGGKVMLDVGGKETMARHFQPRHWGRLEDGTIFLDERSIHDGWAYASAIWTLIFESERKSFTITVRLYSGTELTRLLQKAGFAEVRLYGAYDGRPYDHEARKLVAVASA